MNLVYLNGKFIPRDKATVSILDRGFLLGDGIYEVIPVYHGKLFRLTEHLQRFEKNLQAVHMDNPLSRTEWQRVLAEIVDRNDGLRQSIYLQVTRGVAQRDHVFPKDASPTVLVMSNAVSDSPEIPPGQAITIEDIRWRYCHIKSTSRGSVGERRPGERRCGQQFLHGQEQHYSDASEE
jgi:D-alanine transaminase